MYLLVLRGVLGILYSVGYALCYHHSLTKPFTSALAVRISSHLKACTVLETLYQGAASQALSPELALRLRDPISSLASVQIPGPSVWDGGALSVAVGSLVGEWEWEIDRGQ